MRDTVSTTVNLNGRDPEDSVPPSEPEVLISGVRKSYEDRVVVDVEAFTASAGECLWIRGSNGAGKSTLLRILAGLVRPDLGRVTICGATPGSLTARRLLSFVPDAPALYDDLSVIEHCEYIAGLHSMSPTEIYSASHRVLQALGLDELVEHLPRSLSRGQRQKLSVALGLIRPHRVLLLDEPFEGLDEQGVVGLGSEIDRLANGGTVVLIAGQRIHEPTRSPRIIELCEGKLVSPQR